jgi:hypothetical protein
MYAKPQGFCSATIFYGLCTSRILPEYHTAYRVERGVKTQLQVVKPLLYRRHVSALVLGHHQVSKIHKKKTIQCVCLQVIVHNNLQRDLILMIILIFLVWSYGCVHTPLTWYEQENLGYKAHYEAFTTTPPKHCGFCVSSRCNLGHRATARRSYRPVLAFTKPRT